MVGLIAREIGNWEEELQEQAGLGVLQLLTTSSAFAEHFLSLSLSLLSSQSVWLSVFHCSLQRVSPTYLRSCCVPTVLQLADSVKSISTRAVACQLLGMLAGALREDFTGELSERTLGLAQDPSYEVRLSMTGVLGKIVKSVGAVEREKMLEEVIRLVRDDQLEVRRAAVIALAEVQDQYSPKQRSTILVPLIITELLPDPELEATICTSLAPFLLCCQHHSSLQSIFAFCQRLQLIPNESLHVSLIAALPTLLATSPNTDFAYIERFWTTGSLPSRIAFSEIYPKVRRKQVLHYLSTPSSQALYLQMLTGPATSWSAASHLPLGFQSLSVSNQSQVLQELKNLMDVKFPWRRVLKVLKILPELMENWVIKDALKHIEPAVLKILEKGCWKLQLECVDILGRLVEQNYYKGKRLATCKLMMEEYRGSRTYRKRMLYVSFCAHIVRRVSKASFQTLFFPLLLDLCHDSVSSVRLHLAALLPHIGQIFTSDEDWSRSIAEVMKSLAEDQNKDVAEQANAGLLVMSEHEYWAASKQEEIENEKRVARERRQEGREAQEREEEKRAMLQELTRKARLDYRSTSRRSSSKASSNRTTPTRVKQRSSLSQEKPLPPTIRPFRLPRPKKK